MKKIAFVTLLFVSFTSALIAQTPDYAVAENEISAKLPDISKKNKKTYKLNISRKFAGEREERLLKIAEAVYPTAEKKKKDCSEQAAANAAETGWSCGAFDGVLIPYAITKGALIYYLKTTDEFRRGAKTGIKMKSSSLNYSAEIKFQPDYELKGEKFSGVYVVSMRLSWYQFCGALCAMTFGKDRTVVLDKSGQVLQVDGDGKPPVMVS